MWIKSPQAEERMLFRVDHSPRKVSKLLLAPSLRGGGRGGHSVQDVLWDPNPRLVEAVEEGSQHYSDIGKSAASPRPLRGQRG